MSLSTAAIAGMRVLEARFEQIVGRPPTLLARLVLTYGAKALAEGRCVCLRPSGDGVVLSVTAKKPSAPLTSLGFFHGPEDAQGKPYKS